MRVAAIGVRAAALTAALVLGAAAATPAAPMRHIDYRVAFGLDGTPTDGMIRLDFVAARGEGAVTVDVADDDAIPVRARLDKFGAVETVFDQTLSDADLALLAAVALESENLNGAEVGDQWSRSTAIPGGRSTMQYKVTRNDDRGHVSLVLARTIQCQNGEVSTWRGNIEYDANSFVPTSITFTGQVHAHDAPDARPHAVTVSLKLVKDTFTRSND